ncbi:inositol monophosphatase family protein [Actomonas aquatica]|uniref:Inositol monophosphatase n=1 Tax=Actomonas aquatica TaxID=2866162 RepID=A0ABZ1C7A8_9BACT|nr:inositol monophosphatase [Opitutus sp. WL0086]WRQ87143.1 inositol monophosphatase [Opitutus sp. WL0086]
MSITLDSRTLERARRLLCALQDEIRNTLVAARAQQRRHFAKVAAVTAADTIYQIDKLSEDALLAWLERKWPRRWPVELVMEGLEEAWTFPRGTAVADTVWKLVIDPIDGTRGIMHDKRSAWALSGLAPQRGTRNHLGDIVVAAMTELPTTKQWLADQFSAVKGGGKVVARSYDLRAERWQKLAVAPQTGTTFAHGFSTVSRFFPGGKVWLSEFEERLWKALGELEDGAATPAIFEDQYISCGGQLAEILLGHDLMVLDVRPQAFTAIGMGPDGLSSHPYDLCAELILREAGGVVERPEGGRLRDPLDTTSPVAWAAYANPRLARKVRPVVKRVLGEMG